MSKHDCPCCQVYGPIPQELDMKKFRKAVAKQAKANIARLRREDPKAYADLVASLAALTKQPNPDKVKETERG